MIANQAKERYIQLQKEQPYIVQHADQQHILALQSIHRAEFVKRFLAETTFCHMATF